MTAFLSDGNSWVTPFSVRTPCNHPDQRYNPALLRLLAMSSSRLILYPKEPRISSAVDTIVELLQQQQVADEVLSLPCGADSYQVGERFFDAFLFLGCSPSIELDPPADGEEGPFCYLQVEQSDHCRLVVGKNLKGGCPACRSRYRADDLAAAERLAREEGREVPAVVCGQCGTPTEADQIAWRKSAAPARLTISLWNIFEGEAVPSDRLLDLLQQQTGSKWLYSYLSH